MSGRELLAECGCVCCCVCLYLPGCSPLSSVSCTNIRSDSQTEKFNSHSQYCTDVNIDSSALTELEECKQK